MTVASIQKLKHLQDRKQRAMRLAQAWKKNAPDGISTAFQDLCLSQGRERKAMLIDLICHRNDVLAQLGDPLAASILDQAQKLDHALSYLYFDQRRIPENPLEESHQGEPSDTGEDLTLGERKARARRPAPSDLKKSLMDPHPDVVAIALDHPHLTEQYLVRIFAQRRPRPAVLACIAKHPKWSGQEHVQKMLVFHPNTDLVHRAMYAQFLSVKDRATLRKAPSTPLALKICV